MSVADGASGSLEELIQRAELAIKAAVAATEGAENVNATLVNNVLTITDREGNSTSIDLSGQGGGSVNSVNGKTGNVVLSAEDVNALPSNTPLFSGDYNDLANKPTIPAEQVQSDWNQTNNSSKDFIKNKPTIPTVPTNVSAFTNDAGYLTQHQDISGKADKSEMSVTDGTGTNADKTTITLKTGTSATVLKSHQSLSGKQDVIDSSHKLSADLVDDTNTTNKFTNATEKQTWNNKQDALVSGTNIKTVNNESLLGGGNINIVTELPSNLAYTSNDNGEGIIPSDGIRAVTVTSAATMTISPDVVTVIDGAVGTAAITLQVPQDNLAHVWDILMTTDSTVAITFAMSNSATILTPSGFSIGASKAVEISVIGVGTKYYLRYGEFA